MHIATSLWKLFVPETTSICIYKGFVCLWNVKGSAFSYSAVPNSVLEEASFYPRSINCPGGSEFLTLSMTDSQNRQQKQRAKGLCKPRVGSLFATQSHNKTCFAVTQGMLSQNSLSRRASLLRIVSKLICRSECEFNSQEARVVMGRVVMWVACLLCCLHYCLPPPWSMHLPRGVLSSASKWASEFCYHWFFCV